MQNPNQIPKHPLAFELKGSLITLTVLHLLDADINVFTVQLRKHAQKTPNLFKNMPLVIDLQRINHIEQDIDFAAINFHLRDHGLVPVGIRHGSEKQNIAAQEAGLALLSNQHGVSNGRAHKTAENKSQPEKPTSLIITKPIRSGQQVYAKQANLVVIAPVSNGAELLADGCIHVYGVLRGRALAGVMGDQHARIFCQKLEAELVSIAGYYKLHDDIPKIKESCTQIYLNNEKIMIEGISAKSE